jgi:hypothetical protein
MTKKLKVYHFSSIHFEIFEQLDHHFGCPLPFRGFSGQMIPTGVEVTAYVKYYSTTYVRGRNLEYYFMRALKYVIGI